MADAAPLLSQHVDNNIEQANSAPTKTFDKIFEQSLADFGFPQLIQTLLVGLASFFDSQQIFISVFSDANPTWHCSDPTICDPTRSNICDLPRSAWGWYGPAYKSVISDFGLECSSSVVKGMPTSAFYMGCVAGGFLLAMIPEALFGRKKLLFLSCLAMSLAGIAISLSPNVWIYSLLKFSAGFSRSLIGTYVIVLISERVGTKRRPRAGMIPFTLFVLGFMSLSGIAYANRNSSWRVLYLYTSIPAALYSVLLHLLVLESPRWLYVQGKKQEAFIVLKKISTAEKTTLESCFSRLPLNQETYAHEVKNSIKDLIVRKWAFRRITAAMIIALGVGMSYYGIPLAVGDLNVNIYIAEAASALVELPAFLLSPFLLERFNRRSSLLAVNITGGVSGMLCFSLGVFGLKGLVFCFGLMCFFCARMGFNLMMVYVVELFPTCVRNSATTMVRQALVIGGVISPVLVSVGRKIQSLPFGVFGFALFLCGSFIFCLPETSRSSLRDSMEEEEERDRLSGHC